ncbi:MAG: hypothetical protein GY765_36025, partial [bacterium]|nr:hypothetical protein [bacterium]
MVSILSGFSQFQMSSKKNSYKNSAVMLAEMKMEELMKFGSEKLTEGSASVTMTDYVYQSKEQMNLNYDESDSKYKFASSDPIKANQFRRTSTIEYDWTTKMAQLTVLVDYGAIASGTGVYYPFSLTFTTRRAQ